MFSSSDILTESFIDHLRMNFEHLYGPQDAQLCSQMVAASRMCLSRAGRTDALFFNLEHCIDTCTAGLELLYGHITDEGFLAPRDWVHTITAILASNIGHIRGVCRNDRSPSYVIDEDGITSMEMEPGLTDAALIPLRLQRSIAFVRERFTKLHLLDPEAVIDLVRESDVMLRPNLRNVVGLDVNTSIVRSAGIFGLVCNSQFRTKMVPFYHDINEAGIHEDIGFRKPENVHKKFISYFWQHLFTKISESSPLLEKTGAGRSMLTTMHANLLMSEHELG